MEKNFIILADETIEKQLKKYIHEIDHCFDSDHRIGVIIPILESMLPDEHIVTKELPNILSKKGLSLFPSLEKIKHTSCCVIKEEIMRFLPENDTIDNLLLAVSQLGYRIVLCDNIFIHDQVTGSVEFEWHLQTNDLWDRILTNIKICSFVDNDKKNILYLSHADFQEDASDNIGGVQRHIKDLIDELKTKYNMFLLARNKDQFSLTIFNADKKMKFYFSLGNIENTVVFFDRRHKEIYEAILEQWHIDLIHIHHTYSLTHDLFYIAAKLHIPVYLTIHDFYYYCPKIKLLNDSGEICYEKENCSSCLKKYLCVNEQIAYIDHWREKTKDMFNLCEKIFFPSENTKKFFQDKFPEIMHKTLLIEHGTNLKQKRNKESIPDNFTIAFLGALSKEKGSETVAYMIKNGSKSLNWCIFGGIGDQNILRMEQDNLIKTGWYKPGELNILFDTYKIDLICILSIWPETFCYTLSEAIAEGIPVLVTDVGALGERVKKMDCGWIVPVEDTGKKALDIIETICSNPNEYQKKLTNIQKISLKSIGEMATAYQRIYDQVKKYIPVDFRREEKYAKMIYEGCRWKLKEYKTKQNVVSEEQRYNDLLLQEVLNSSSWKITAPLRALKRRLSLVKKIIKH